MKKLVFILFAFSICKSVAQPFQTYSYDYRKVTIPELAQEFCDQYPDADAVVIFEKADYRFTPYETKKSKSLMLVMTVETKIKIYNEEGIKYALFKIPYYSPKYEPEIVRIKGSTYNIENTGIKRRKLRKSTIETVAIADDYYIKRVMLGNVKPGSVVELKYVIQTPYPENIRPWRFQKEIPVMHSSLDYREIPFFTYKLLRSDTQEPVRQQTTELNSDNTFGSYKYKTKLNSFKIDMVPTSLTESESNKGSFDFQLIDRHFFFGEVVVDISKNQQQVCANLLNDAKFGKYLKAAEKEAANQLSSLALNGKTDSEKAEIIAAYVASTYKWNGITTKSASKKFNVFSKTKEGTSAELNLLLCALLKTAGLDASPIVVSERPGGATFEDYPFSLLLDRVLVALQSGESTYYVDATSDTPLFDDFSSKYPNTTGLIVR